MQSSNAWRKRAISSFRTDLKAAPAESGSADLMLAVVIFVGIVYHSPDAEPLLMPFVS